MPHFTPEELDDLEMLLLQTELRPFAESASAVFPRLAAELRRLWDIEELCGRLQTMIDKTPPRTFEEVSKMDV